MTAQFAPTPSQTVGPYLSIGLTWTDGADVVPEGIRDAVWIRGRLLDGVGASVPDGLIETWQADPGGRFAHPDDPRGTLSLNGFRGYGRCATDASGGFALRTVKPGRVPDGQGGLQAPHIDVSVFARGLLNRVITRWYFADEVAANAEDIVLSELPEDDRATLVAQPEGDGYRLDIVLQGEHEAVFFAL